ncbi:hypothetical protein [Longimicrobium terrae]|uniref:Uncharacterized protein n=1 Tax=Longimicrobium terrae TaxID=1639882 RepID=A0A841GWB3_9BACT|nr:hypothetical protein [Longimicrobium terrae]MBB4634624.1 hypothetical protein [Longimicrobium terrae]MBB6068486.1 hypothetical protein [Longimicrobium terrae]NNC27676.1 hypothetical protein [Longimicrobium terrae]
MQNLSLSQQQRVRLRQAAVLGITLYGILCLRSPETFRLLDFVNLPVHETGHLVFAPFGEFMAALGGTLLQLIMPLCFVVSFHRRKDYFAAAIVLAWVAQNLWNISVYIGDARAQVLPLVGGGEHDWAYILGRLDLLEHDQAVAGWVRFAGAALFAFAMLRAWHWSARAPVSPAEQRRPGSAPGSESERL